MSTPSQAFIDSLVFKTLVVLFIAKEPRVVVEIKCEGRRRRGEVHSPIIGSMIEGVESRDGMPKVFGRRYGDSVLQTTNMRGIKRWGITLEIPFDILVAVKTEVVSKIS
jgi:hypothetical protein